jgi:hypothetical protein
MVPSWGYAQTESPASLTGIVTDASSNDPIPGVNVFLSGTALGSTTDAGGRFTITRIPPGIYDVIISIPGYEREIRRAEVQPQGARPLRVALHEKLIEAGPVDIVGEEPSEWKDRLERFGKSFFGTTRNAGRCRLLNPEVLEFSVDKESGRFEASSETPLRIENRALGYRMEFLMRTFLLEGQVFKVGGWTKFEELQPENDEQKAEWLSERRRAYAGSLRHFLASAVAGTLEQEGFRISQVRGISLNIRPSLVPEEELRSDIIRTGGLSFERELTFEDYLRVDYQREFQEGGFEEYWKRIIGETRGWSERHQFSWLRLSVRPVMLSSDGLPYDSSYLETYGYWAYERVAEWLPLEYRP